MKHVGLGPRFITGLPLGQQGWTLGPYVIVVSIQDNSHIMATVKIGLIILKEIGVGIMHIPPQVLWIHHVPGEMCKLWAYNIVHGESLNAIMTRQVRFNIVNMLWYTHG